VARSARALKWSYAGVGARVVLQLGAQIALARFVGPEGFGAVAAALFVIQVANIIVELGLGDALVQSRHISNEDMRVAYTRIAFCALMCAMLVVLLAGFVASWFGNPQVASVLRWMTLVVVVQAFGVVPLSILRRRLDFRSIQLAQVGSYLVGFVGVGVTSAWLGAGVWSLVAAWVTQAVVATAIQFLYAPHDIVPVVRFASTSLTGFGLRTTFGNLINLSAEHIDKIIIGRSYGSAALGLYSVGYNLVRTPVNHVVLSLQQVVYSFSARAQDDPDTMRQTYLALLWMVPMLTLPTFMSVALLAPTIVDALYGSDWRDVAAVLLPLSLAMPLHSVQAVGGPILRGSDRVEREILISLVCTVLMVLVLVGSAYISFVAMAWGVWAVYLVRSGWTVYEVSRLLNLSMFLSLSMPLGGILVGILTSGALFVVNDALTNLGLSAIYRLVAMMLLGMLLLPAILWAGLGWIVPRVLHDVLSQIAARLPRQIRQHVTVRLPECG
jgi:PST family polysaccharide transporter